MHELLRTDSRAPLKQPFPIRFPHRRTALPRFWHTRATPISAAGFRFDSHIHGPLQSVSRTHQPQPFPGTKAARFRLQHARTVPTRFPHTGATAVSNLIPACATPQVCQSVYAALHPSIDVDPPINQNSPAFPPNRSQSKAPYAEKVQTAMPPAEGEFQIAKSFHPPPKVKKLKKTEKKNKK